MPRVDRPDLGKIDTGTQLCADDLVGNLCTISSLGNVDRIMIPVLGIFHIDS